MGRRPRARGVLLPSLSQDTPTPVGSRLGPFPRGLVLETQRVVDFFEEVVKRVLVRTHIKCLGPGLDPGCHIRVTAKSRIKGRTTRSFVGEEV